MCFLCNPSRNITLAIIAVLIMSACSPVTQPGNGNPQTSSAFIQLNGAGASFPEPIYKEWTYLYNQQNPSVSINYQGIGSGGGKKAIVDNVVDFAGSDSLLKELEYAAGKDLQMFPVLAGAVVVIYNIEGLAPDDTALVLERSALVGIFDGSIKKWNDAAILKTNPSLKDKLPQKNITVVHRSDGSGTTEIFTKALAAFDPKWKTNVGAGTSVQWPVDKAGNGVGGKGNQGVAVVVQKTPNSIGYVELSNALANQIPFASLLNKSGQVVNARAESVQAALLDFANAFDARMTATVVDAPGSGSWPILGYTYLVLHTQSMRDCIKATALMNYITWALTASEAKEKAIELGYAPLPEAVTRIVLAKLKQVTCDGKALLSP